MAEKVADEEKVALCDKLRHLKVTIVHRAIVAWDRSPETFDDEIVSLNDVDEALRNNCG